MVPNDDYFIYYQYKYSGIPITSIIFLLMQYSILFDIGRIVLYIWNQTYLSTYVLTSTRNDNVNNICSLDHNALAVSITTFVEGVSTHQKQLWRLQYKWIL